MTKCARCDKRRNCQLFTLYAVQLCEACVHLIVSEWHVKRQGVGGLVQS